MKLKKMSSNKRSRVDTNNKVMDTAHINAPQHFKKLGSGSFSDVYDYMGTVVKRLKRNKGDKTYIISASEINLLFTHDCPFLVKGLSTYQHNYGFDIFMEKCTGSIKEIRDYKTIKKVMLDLSMGLDYMHKRGILHLDICINNCMYTKLPNGEFIGKLIDFGLSSECVPSESGELVINTRELRITAPSRPYENLVSSDEPYSNKSDIWSLGISFFEILRGVELFKSIDQVIIDNHFSKSHPKVDWEKSMINYLDSIRNDQSNVLFTDLRESKKIQMKEEDILKTVDFLLKLLDFNKEKRFSSEKIINDGYFNDIKQESPSDKISEDILKDTHGEKPLAISEENSDKIPEDISNKNLLVFPEDLVKSINFIISQIQRDFEDEPCKLLIFSIDLFIRFSIKNPNIPYNEDILICCILLILRTYKLYYEIENFFEKFEDVNFDLENVIIRSVEGKLIKDNIYHWSNNEEEFFSSFRIYFEDISLSSIQKYINFNVLSDVFYKPLKTTKNCGDLIDFISIKLYKRHGFRRLHNKLHKEYSSYDLNFFSLCLDLYMKALTSSFEVKNRKDVDDLIDGVILCIKFLLFKTQETSEISNWLILNIDLASVLVNPLGTNLKSIQEFQILLKDYIFKNTISIIENKKNDSDTLNNEKVTYEEIIESISDIYQEINQKYKIIYKELGTIKDLCDVVPFPEMSEI